MVIFFYLKFYSIMYYMIYYDCKLDLSSKHQRVSCQAQASDHLTIIQVIPVLHGNHRFFVVFRQSMYNKSLTFNFCHCLYEY